VPDALERLRVPERRRQVRLRRLVRRSLVLVERHVALVVVVRLLAELAHHVLGVRDPQAITVRQADGLRQRDAPVAVLLLLQARQLGALLVERLEELADLGDLRELDGLLADGQVLLERVERVVRRGPVAQDRDPVLDLRALDLHRGLQLLVGAHDRVRGHLAEVPGEHGVPPAFLDLLSDGALRATG